MEAPLTPTEARKLLSRLLLEGAPLAYVPHARVEMEKDDLTEVDTRAVLRFGRIFEPAELERFSWRYRVHRERICVVFRFDEERAVIVVTAWRRR